jgi:hypothetical protein
MKPQLEQRKRSASYFPLTSILANSVAGAWQILQMRFIQIEEFMPQNFRIFLNYHAFFGKKNFP